MKLASEFKSFFDPKVRQRGEEYARSGAVDFIDQNGDWLDFIVRGSGYNDYEVGLHLNGTGGLIDLVCNCPHYDDGNNCKHLWAAILKAESMGLIDAGSSSTNGKPKKKKASTWRTLLDRQSPQKRFEPEPAGLGELVQHRRVHYLLELASCRQTPVVSLYQQQRKKDGQFGIAKPLYVTHHLLDKERETFDPTDLKLLGMLLGNQANSGQSAYFHEYRSPNNGIPLQVELAPELYDTILPALCKTGRFAWLLAWAKNLEDARRIEWEDGSAWQFRLRAEKFDRNRKWRIRGEVYRGKQELPVQDAVFCFASGLILLNDKLAKLDVPQDDRWLQLLREQGELVVPVKDRESLLAELWRTGQPPQLSGDNSLQLSSELGTPRGRLIVHPPVEKSYSRRASRTLYASVEFQYDGHQTTPLANSGGWILNGGKGYLQRNREAESQLMSALRELSLQPKETNYYGQTPPGHLQFAAKELDRIVETLTATGWHVEAEGSLIRRSGSLSVSVSSGIDWFDVEGQVDFDGQEVPLPDLLSAIRRGEKYIELGDGTRGLLPQEWLDKYAPLTELSARREGDALRFQPGQALLLDSLLAAREAEIDLQVDRQFAATRKRLQSFAGVKPISAAKVFRGELRDYQKEGLGWLRFLEKFNFGGCLADDMGLGKTIQVLALLVDRCRRQPQKTDRRPSLIVAPKSLTHNWRLEAEKFAPRVSVADYTGIDRKERIEDFNEYDLIVTTYGTLRNDAEELSETQWDYAVLDEAQAIKNAASQSAKASRLLDARHRLALSGTPVENHLGELWSIFEFLNPGFLGKSQSLRQLSAGRTDDDDARIEALRKGLAPFLLRRTKQQVLPQLPKKTEQTLYCDLKPAQRKQYNALRDHYRAALTKRIAKSGMAKSKIQVLEALLRLRQAACHPGLVDGTQAKKSSAKLDLLLEQLTQAVEEGRKTLVFSQFTSMLTLVKEKLDKANVCYEYLDGKTSNRQQRVDRFQTDASCPIFLISLKAGGVGLNLTAADLVFILDPWWNPAVEAQAIDRAHRIGQTKPVFAYRLIARDTVEEKILELQTKKKDLANAIISGDGSLLKQLSADDLQSLLS